MLQTVAIVVRREGKEAIVEARPSGGCGQCGDTCGTGKLSQLFCTQPRRFRVHNGIDAGIGEEVHVSVADGVLLRSALTMYLLPLLLALGGGMLGMHWADTAARGDAYAALGVALGLAAGFVLIRLSALRRTEVLPVITR